MSIRITTKYWMEQMALPFHPTHINVEDQSNRHRSYTDLLLSAAIPDELEAVAGRDGACAALGRPGVCPPPMLPVDDKGQYQAVVPAEQVLPRWDFMYLIEVMDNQGNGKIYPDLNKETPYVVVHLVR